MITLRYSGLNASIPCQVSDRKKAVIFFIPWIMTLLIMIDDVSGIVWLSGIPESNTKIYESIGFGKD